ncbi:MAG: hypothetical protein ACM3NZ_08235, partial [Betaproteobacteria bacterium]
IIEWLPKSYESPMAQPNYSYAKRQRELAKKKKREAKQQKKAAAESPSVEPVPGKPDEPQPT